LGTSDAEDDERRDQITALYKSARFLPSLAIPNKRHFTGFQNVILCILKAMAPAESAKSSNYTKSQLDYAIHDGRYNANSPRTSVALPIQWLNPAVGHFLDAVKSELTPPNDIIRQTVEYMKAEQQHRNVLSPLLRAIIEVNQQ
jgi:hypothetical protein